MAGIMVVFGTRPEAIKLLPVVEALRERGLPTRICVTAQHRDLLDQMLAPECVVPDIDLDLMRPGETLTDQAGRLLAALGNVFEQERPSTVVVQGDTATALAAAQAAYLARIPVAHVEAGLRTGDLLSPHPEEGNRRMIAALARWHFAPTAVAASALAREGISADAIHVTGNTAVDALHAARRNLDSRKSELPLAPVFEAAVGRRLLLFTCHRRENIPQIANVAEAALTLGARDDVFVAWALHPNPHVREEVEAILTDAPRVALLEPLAFMPFVRLLSQAHLILTDSGGVQEEAPVLGVPVLVLRDTTERPEGVVAGTSILVGTETQTIVAQATRLLDNPLAHHRMARVHSPYGDGRAAERIAEVLARALGQAPALMHSSAQ
jgi:UDP-N-acetylglucosamine 2-epimerase (non-hydrolysing)